MRNGAYNLAKVVEVFLAFLIIFKLQLQWRRSDLVLNMRTAPAVTRFPYLCCVNLGSVYEITLIMTISFSTHASNWSAFDGVTLINLVRPVRIRNILTFLEQNCCLAVIDIFFNNLREFWVFRRFWVLLVCRKLSFQTRILNTKFCNFTLKLNNLVF